MEAKGKSSESVKTFEAFYELIKQEASKLQKEYQPPLRNRIKIAIDLIKSVQKAKKDGDVKVKIAPNTKEDEYSISFEELVSDPQLQKDISLYPELEKTLKENPAKRKLWKEFNNYIGSRTTNYWEQFKEVPFIETIRGRAVKALCKYPDGYLNAFEVFGKPKADLILRHGVDYGDDFYDLIEAFKEKESH